MSIVAWNPYEWHDHHKPGKPRWRVKAGLAEKREALCTQLDAISVSLESASSFGMVDKWHQVHEAILACEECEAS